jgi:hypothetical protein
LICLRALRVGATGQGAHTKGVGLEIVYPRVAAIDVGKKIVAVAVRTPGRELQAGLRALVEQFIAHLANAWPLRR